MDLRFAEDHDGELYVLTKSDGMIRKVVSAKASTSSSTTANAPAPIAAGKRTYDALCAVCHGTQAQGAIKAGIAISIIEEQKGKQPPDLTDESSDHGSTDRDVFTVIKRGVPSTMMPAFTGQLTDDDIRHVINYIRSLQPRK